MVVLVHPFGNANVRAALQAFEQGGLLAKFVTTVGWSEDLRKVVPQWLRPKVGRRSYALPRRRIQLRPARELARLLAGHSSIGEHERGWASVDAVLQDLDRFAAQFLQMDSTDGVSVVYAYEDCAEHCFTAAKPRGIRCIYDLPIAHWETAQRLLREEAERYPQWEPTLGATRDSPAKLERKSRELALADTVICPSRFVLESLPRGVTESKQCVLAAFGSPSGLKDDAVAPRLKSDRLRVLFAGAMTQRKGLADVFAAMKVVDAGSIELVVMGSPIQPLDWYRREYRNFTYEPPRPHADVLRLMATCDLLVLPSIVEGRALVQQEAMACGLPLIATLNAGADDLVDDGVNGFLVPIRSPEAVADRISWCASHRDELRGMGIAAKKRAREFTWSAYGETLLGAVRNSNA